jgi:hypothetical protein
MAAVSAGTPNSAGCGARSGMFVYDSLGIHASTRTFDPPGTALTSS